MDKIVDSGEIPQSSEDERGTEEEEKEEKEEHLGDLLAGMVDGGDDDSLDAVAVVRELRERT